MKQHDIVVPKTARYFTLEPKGEVRQVLFVIHGYRQLANRFIQKFEPLVDDGVLVIAPEGMHRFYVKGSDGHVGASWMTKEDRLVDIQDYVNYLNQLIDELDLPDVPLNLLGFSQGGPTACRWMARCTHSFQRLILHSTVIPNDFDFDQQRDRFNESDCYAVFGDSDQFADEQRIEEKMLWMKKNGISPELLRFRGGHDIHLPSVEAILKNN